MHSAYWPGLFTNEDDREASPPERGNASVPWSGPQIELVERVPEKKRERRTEHQRRH